MLDNISSTELKNSEHKNKTKIIAVNTNVFFVLLYSPNVLYIQQITNDIIRNTASVVTERYNPSRPPRVPS